jgi:PBSX family phage terminase large subunit
MPTDWYKPGPKMAEFHRSKARLRVLVGARGSGKTTGIAIEAMGHCWHNPGARVYLLRKTEESQDNSTLKTFELAFRECGSAYVQTDTSLFKKIEGGKYFRLPSEEAVKLFNKFKKTNPNKSEILQWLDSVGNQFCSFLHFSGVPDSSKRDTRFRGYECSMLIFVEADQLAREDLDMALFCLRWKGADGEYIKDACCILDTNPPPPSHWIAKMEEEFVTDTTAKFWHIPMDENEHNLPPGYVASSKRMYANNPAMYKRMILGEYAEAFSGSRVFHKFSEQHAGDDLPWPAGAYLIRGWDFGTHNAVVFSAYWEVNNIEYWWDLYESVLDLSDTDRQAAAARDITNAVFPFHNDRSICAGVFDASDPAGAAKAGLTSQVGMRSHLDVLSVYHIYPKYSHKHRSLALSIAGYNHLLDQRDPAGRLVYRICRKGCPKLYLASLGGYRYPEVGETGYGSGEPGKGPDFGGYDHVADASRYGKVNFLKLVKSKMEEAVKPVGKLAPNTNVNPKRRWR